MTFERLANADKEPEDWLTYSGQLHAQRYTRLDQINRENVDRLELKWAYQLPVSWIERRRLRSLWMG